MQTTEGVLNKMVQPRARGQSAILAGNEPASADERYLLGNGWRFDPRLDAPRRAWYDPLAGKPDRKVKGLEYTDQHNQQQHKTQTAACSAPWAFTLAEALEIQRARDAGGQ